MKKRFLGFMALVMAAVASMGVLAGCDGWFDKDDNADASVNVGSGSADEGELTLLDKLYENKEHIVIDLTDRVTTFPSAEARLWGGKATKTITINGNGNKLFIDESVKARIQATTGAKIIFNDVVIEGTQNVAAGWSAHDLLFANETELNNVFFEQEIAFAATGKTMKMKDVVVYTALDLYAIWVEAGTHLDMDNCEILATKGRTVKISDEYVNAPMETYLNVRNTKFVSVKKAAILVGSAAGAKITLENVDISGVKADSKNHVWIDFVYPDTLSKVAVGGGFMRLEQESENGNN